MAQSQTKSTAKAGKLENLAQQLPLKESDPKDGISHLPIKPWELGNVPGMCKNWEQEIKRRVQEIEEAPPATFAGRARKLLNRDKQTKSKEIRITGEEILLLRIENRKLKELTIGRRGLVRDPKSFSKRMAVIREVLSEGKPPNLTELRLLLIHAVVACHFGTMNTLGVNQLLMLQTRYLEALFKFGKQGLHHISEDLKEKKEVGTLQPIHVKAANKKINRIKGLQQTAREMLKNQPRGRSSLNAENFSIEEKQIKKYVDTSEGGGLRSEVAALDKEKQTIMTGAVQVISLARHCNLLTDVILRYIKSVEVVDKQSPLIEMVSASVFHNKLFHYIGQYHSGLRSDQVVAKIVEMFKRTYHALGLAAKKVGKVPDSREKGLVLYEFADVVHYFCLIVEPIIDAYPNIKKHLPQSTVESYLKIAEDNLLTILSHKAHVGSLAQQSEKLLKSLQQRSRRAEME